MAGGEWIFRYTKVLSVLQFGPVGTNPMGSGAIVGQGSVSHEPSMNVLLTSFRNNGAKNCNMRCIGRSLYVPDCSYMALQCCNAATIAKSL